MSRYVSALAASIVLFCSVSSADPLSGKWVLNVKRSHYGPGAEPRREETFTCERRGDRLSCTIRSSRTNGRRLIGTFEATYDGRPYKTTGIPEVDEVRLERIDDHTADATFTFKGQPVFGYRAVRSDDGHSLTIVSVEARTRVALSSVIVYDEQ